MVLVRGGRMSDLPGFRYKVIRAALDTAGVADRNRAARSTARRRDQVVPRRAVISRRPLMPDPVYDSPLVTQLVNRVMLDGKKSTSEGIVYGRSERP